MWPSRKVLLIRVGGIAALTLLVVAAVINHPYTFHGSLYTPPFQAPDFTLRDQNGHPFHLAAEQGKIVLIYFGFTNCPDECPGTLAVFQQVRSALGSQSGQVQFVFITLDPVNDTPGRLQSFLAPYQPGMIALTGQETDLAPVWKAYGAYLAEPGDQTIVPGEHINHSDQVYLVDRQGKVRLTYAFPTAPEDLLADLRHLLNG